MVASIALISAALQQYLPFTVLKLNKFYAKHFTRSCNSTYRLRYWNSNLPIGNINCSSLQQYLPFTVLKLARFLIFYSLSKFSSCNSTYRLRYWNSRPSSLASASTFAVATVLTVYGIETITLLTEVHCWLARLQQYLPFTVLKLPCIMYEVFFQTYGVATVPTVYGIETHK